MKWVRQLVKCVRGEMGETVDEIGETVGNICQR